MSIPKNVHIAGLGRYVPETVLTNHDLEKMVDTSDEWITTRTGIKERRIVGKGEKASHMACRAAAEALADAGMDARNIDLIIVATSTPDSPFPSTACLVQRSLRAPHAVAFDITAACSGFLFALSTAKQYLQTGLYKNALVIASEAMSSIVDWKDRNTCVLFGDGAGACVLKTTRARRGIIAEFMMAHGEYCDLMAVVTEDVRHPFDRRKNTAVMPYVRMQGKEIFKIAVASMAHAVRMVVKKAGINLDQIDCVVPHQANDRIISAVAKKLRVPKERFFINIGHYGNMSAASTAVALYDAVKEKKIRKGSTVAMVTFGAGLVSAANIVEF